MSELQFAWTETSPRAGCDSRGTVWSLPLQNSAVPSSRALSRLVVGCVSV